MAVDENTVGNDGRAASRVPHTAEAERLATAGAAWKRIGPYLSERAWGTVREDYSPDGSAWEYFPHDHARSRVFRWGEDGIAGLCDDRQILCLALALWNGRDPILKERLFGLTGKEGNHGEDVKEIYYYLDATPSHSYLRMLYKYPQAAFPYEELLRVAAERTRDDPEYELIDTGVFDEDRYFDVFVEYARASPDDLLIRIQAVNRGPEAAPIWLLPTLWYRNTWAFDGRRAERPVLSAVAGGSHAGHGGSLDDRNRRIHGDHDELGDVELWCEAPDDLLFTNNETNLARLFGIANPQPFVKDAFHRHLVNGEPDAVNSELHGTKAAALWQRTVQPGESLTIRLRLRPLRDAAPDPLVDFEEVFARRRREADEYHASLQAPRSDGLDEDLARIQRQALAGMIWSKQLYIWDVSRWLDGDPAQPPPPAERHAGRNASWRHFNSHDVLSMPDKWEYPWFAAWDSAFHCLPLAMMDADFAKSQLVLLGREWFQHPNGAVPAYEWAFGDVNPPVLAWAAWRVFSMERHRTGAGDREFLERVFHKLLLNFTWWVNRKDQENNNVFEGGFLGLDNIGPFDRSGNLPAGVLVEQSDGTGWMGVFSLSMLNIALELALHDHVYEDIATKFFEHFLYIAAAMTNLGNQGLSLWDDEDEFFYDVVRFPDGSRRPLRLRSLVGLIPLLAVETIEPETLERLPGFRERLEWFLRYRPDLAGLTSRWHVTGQGDRRLVALVRGHRMKRILRRLLDPDEFLSDQGIRALSKHYERDPYVAKTKFGEFTVAYEPAESRSGLFGGNSNWRGPVWFPVNYFLIEALQKFHWYYGDDFLVECPTGSGQMMTLDRVADEISRRLISIFRRRPDGTRPVFGGQQKFQHDPHFRDHLLFYEYFHGDNGAGIGASHQTGWTGLVAKLIQQQAVRGRLR